MSKDNALRILDIMYRLTVILISCSKDIDSSLYHELEECQDDINDLYYSILL